MVGVVAVVAVECHHLACDKYKYSHSHSQMDRWPIPIPERADQPLIR